MSMTGSFPACMQSYKLLELGCVTALPIMKGFKVVVSVATILIVLSQKVSQNFFI